MSVTTKPAAPKKAVPKKAVRELKNLRTVANGPRLKAAFCRRCHRCS